MDKPKSMQKRIFFALFSILILASGCQTTLAVSEAKRRCSCIKTIYREVERRERKTDPKRYRPPSQTGIEGAVVDCSVMKRGSESHSTIANMPAEERQEFDKKVEEAMLKKCPKRYKRLRG